MNHCKIPDKNLRSLTDKVCFQAFFGLVYKNQEVSVQASTQND